MFIHKNFLRSVKKSLVFCLTVTLFTMILLQSTPSSMAWAEDQNPAGGMGLGLASFITTIPYGCFKIAYATLGAVIGGFTYVLTGANADAAGVIWNKSMNGTYVLTPDHLRGKKPVRFFGDMDPGPGANEAMEESAPAADAPQVEMRGNHGGTGPTPSFHQV